MDNGRMPPAPKEPTLRRCDEVDNQLLAKWLSEEDGRRSVIAGLWNEIKELVDLFLSFKVRWVHREANRGAHV
uniref:RNase H type-1 domain-containing protein n=1 Tax=Leersia perrieri TaxID=77586 RepID=A0A0D9XDY5_9ORYZ